MEGRATGIIMIVIDGASDRPQDGRTPLEAAKTPFLDRLASQGKLGLLYTVGKGIAPESDAGVFSLLGYDPIHVHLARGVAEAMGAGIQFNNGDLALRAGFATVDGDRLVDRRAGRNLSTLEAKELGTALNTKLRLKDNVNFDFQSTVGHRAVVVFRPGSMMRLSSNISNFDPAYVRKGNVSVAVSSSQSYDLPRCDSLDHSPESIRSAALVNEFGFKARGILDDHPVNRKRREEGRLPANWILMRDAGVSKPAVENFGTKWDLNPAMVADLPVELGIGKLLGMRVEQLVPSTSLDAYRERARQTLKLSRDHDFVYAHLKGPDEPGHDGLYELKMKRIEEIDACFFSEIVGSNELDHLIVCVTCDHSTPWKGKAHSDDPVPVLLVSPADTRRRLRDHLREARFVERDAEKGELGTLSHGSMVLDLLKTMI